MNYPRTPNPRSSRGGFTVMELLVAVAIIVVLASIAFTVMGSMKSNADLARATEKIKSIGSAFVGYTSENNGLLPYEDAPGTDDWTNAAKPEASEAWYNVLPLSMGAKSVGQIGQEGDPGLFYQESYPLFVPGAPYPKGDKKFTEPLFAFGMSSRLQRKDEQDYKAQGSLASIIDPVRTVIFLERGLPGDEKVNKAQRGFDGGPKANPRAFAGRHNGKGILLFADGHIEVRQVSDLITPAGMIIYPQDRVIWTADPDEDPN